jgi:hypothetical protein
MFTAWRKSSYSGSSNQSTCVEVGLAPGRVGVRDTKNRAYGHLDVPSRAWRAFVAGVAESQEVGGPR